MDELEPGITVTQSISTDQRQESKQDRAPMASILTWATSCLSVLRSQTLDAEESPPATGTPPSHVVWIAHEAPTRCPRTTKSSSRPLHCDLSPGPSSTLPGFRREINAG